MPTVTQSYGNITTDKKYPVLCWGYSHFLELSPMSISDYLDGIGEAFRDFAFPDFIVTSKEGALTIQGMLTVLNAPVCVVPLLTEPIPTEGDDVGAVFLVTEDITNHELKELIDRIPPIVGGYNFNTTYILIHGDI